MNSRLKLLALALVTALPGIAFSAGQLPDGSTPEQKAIVAGDLPFRAVRLGLEDLPASSGKPRVLFNGRNLDAWDSWLGMKNPSNTYAPSKEKPIGKNHDDSGVFSVVTEDGAPAILSNGKIWGGLITKEVYSNYHLRLQFKWGKNNWVPNMPRNNGVLYHSHGPYGAFFGTWMSAIEFEIVPNSVGMLLAVGDSQGKHSFADVHWKVNANVNVGQDKQIPYPHRRFMPDGHLVPVKVPAFNVDAALDAEKPMGEWNTLDLYVFGNQSVHVVNGVPVMVAHDISTSDAPGKPSRPLTEGRIQLQSEGAETYFREISIEPIERLPTVRVL
jgi:hypothetical protein